MVVRFNVIRMAAFGHRNGCNAACLREVNQHAGHDCFHGAVRTRLKSLRDRVGEESANQRYPGTAMDDGVGS